MKERWDPMTNAKQVPRSGERNSSETYKRRMEELVKDIDNVFGQAMMSGPAETAGDRFRELGIIHQETMRILNDNTKIWGPDDIEKHQKGLDTLAKRYNIDPSVTDGLIAKLRMLAEDSDEAALSDPSI